jgi:hypothetical protein
MSCQVKHPVSANYETEKHQYFSIVSLPTDSVIVDHAVAINVCALKMVEVPTFFTKNNETSGVV